VATLLADNRFRN